MGFLKEYLVRLGVQDNFTDKLSAVLKNGSSKVSKFVGGWGGQWALAGGAVISAMAVSTVGVAKFIQRLVNADDQLNQLARTTLRTKEAAWQTQSAVTAMGKSLEEVRTNPRLYREFLELRKLAQQIQPPDMSEGLEQARTIIAEYHKLRQVGGAAIQWVGFYLLKYIQKPMEQLRVKLGSINDRLVKALPVWSEKIGMALSWIVRLGAALLRSLGAVYQAVKRLFEMIPGEVKLALAALAAFGMFIRAGPIGQLIMILSAALLLLEDFYTYLDGGESLLGPVWKTLVDLFDGFTNSGKNALEYLSEDFFPALVGLLETLGKKLLEKAAAYAEPLIRFGVEVSEGLIKLLSAMIPQVLGLLARLGVQALSTLLQMLPMLIEAGTQLITALINGAAEMLPELVSLVADVVQKLISLIIRQLPRLVETGFQMLLKLLQGLWDAVPSLVEAVSRLLDRLLKLVEGNAPGLAQGGKDLIAALARGIAKAVPLALQIIVDLLLKLLKTIVSHLPRLLRAGADLLLALVRGLLSMLPTLVQSAVELIGSLRQAIWERIPEILQTGAELLLTLVGGLWQEVPQIGQVALEIIGALLNGLGTLEASMLDLGASLVKSLWGGVASKASWLKDKVKNFFAGILKGVKETFSGGEEPDGESSAPVPDQPPPTPTPAGPSAPLPGHAEGGVFAKEHVARFAEDGKPEAVVPLTKPARAQEVLGQVAQFLGGRTASGETAAQLSAMQSFLEKAEGLLTRMDSFMKAGAAAAASGNTSTVNNNQQYDMRTSYTIYDSSGNPQSTAQAVDRQQQLRIRNLMGVID